MSIVAIIPARGGSKRIPEKNIRPFAGRPIIAYPIQAARDSGLFDRIIVSTDSPKIGAIATEYGAEVPFLRPAELADDMAATAPVIVHALQWLAEQGQPATHFCCIYPAAPFVRPEDLRSGLERLRAAGAVTAFSVAAYATPIFRALKINEQGALDMIWPEYEMSRSQDLPAAYHDAGQFYWGDSGKFLVEKRLYASVSIPVVLPGMLVQDIDTLEDWEMAESKFQYLAVRP
jgi:N-acylneuraminate cytidylyltransferase